MKQDYICEECGIKFTRDNCGKNPRFCCLECFTNYKIKNRKHYICKNCGKEFIRHNLDKNKTFCSVDCSKKYRKENAIQTPEYLKEWNKKYHMENKEEIRRKSKEYRDKNIDIIRAKAIKKGKTPSSKYSNYRSIAKRRNIDFNITKEEFIALWNKPCSYCGSEIVGIGVDRVDNTIGYQVDNIVPCCSWCNKMKLVATKEDFINHCKKIVDFNKTF
jgi:hypothetical protein